MKSVQKLGSAAPTSSISSKSKSSHSVSKKSSTAVPSKSSTFLIINTTLESSDTKITIVPAATQSLITLYNVKEFLIDQKFIPTDDIRKNGVKKPPQVMITRDPKKLSPLANKHAAKFLVVDSVDTLKPQDWYTEKDNNPRDRIVAVFATGQEWQFDTWANEWKKPVYLFSKVLGFSLRYQDEPPTGSITKWNVKQLQVY